LEALKKYWWLFLLIPIGCYLLYVSLRAKKEVAASMQKARDAKAEKAILKTVETETVQDAGSDQGNN